MTSGVQWPVELYGQTPDGTFVHLRPLRRSDRREWGEVRTANWGWLAEWEPTPIDPDAPLLTFGQFLRRRTREARAGQAMPFVIEVDGRLVGAITFSNIVDGVFRSATVGYWVAQSAAGHGIAPTALAIVADHAIATRRLHRIEVNIRPENEKSLAVVRKLGFREEGLRRRFLHIDGAWRDHLSFALTTEDLGGRTFMERLTDSAG